MDFESWIRRWLARHPLREPEGLERTEFTTEIMNKIKAQEKPAPSYVLIRRAVTWPRLALVATAAAVLIVVGRQAPSTVRVAEEFDQGVELLTALDEPLLIEGTEELDALAGELEAQDALLFAEALGSDEEWIEETLLLLDQLDEELPGNTLDEVPDEQWLKELELLDESELLAPS